MVREKDSRSLGEILASVSPDDSISEDFIGWPGEEKLASRQEFVREVQRRISLAMDLTRGLEGENTTIDSLEKFFLDIAREENEKPTIDEPLREFIQNSKVPYNYAFDILTRKKRFNVLERQSNLFENEAALISWVFPKKRGETFQMGIKESIVGPASFGFIPELEDLIACFSAAEKKRLENKFLRSPVGILFYEFICTAYSSKSFKDLDEAPKGIIFHLVFLAVDLNKTTRLKGDPYQFRVKEVAFHFRYWDEKSQKKLGVFEEEVEDDRIWAVLLEGMRNLHPFQAGTPGSGKKS